MGPPILFLMVCLLSVTSINAQILSANSYLTPSDRITLKKVIDPGLKLENLPGVYYAVFGYKLLGEPLPNNAEICKYVINAVKDSNISPENAFHAVSIWKSLKNCAALPVDSMTMNLNGIIGKDTSTIPELYHAVSALKLLSPKLSDTLIGSLTKTLQNTLKKDDNLWNLGYTFHIASHLGPAGSFAFDRIEDAIIQADEVDGKLLQFEGGLSITSHIINGVYELSMSLNKKPPFKPLQMVKFANYLLSRRSVQSPKSVVGLILALNTMATNKFDNPVCITVNHGGDIISEQQPLLSLKICDILGNPLSAIPKVAANSIVRTKDDSVVLKNVTFTSSSKDKTLFTLNLMENKLERGFHKVYVTAGTVTNTIQVKVQSKITLSYLEIGTGDADQTTQPKLTKATFPQKLKTKIEADSQQKLIMRFSLQDMATLKSLRVHQAFVRLSPAGSNKDDHDVIYVAEPDTANVYKFEMPVGSSASNFGHKSGDYDLELIVGDATLSNSFQWTVATVGLTFPHKGAVESARRQPSYKQKPNVYTTKPEIKHMFREPEKRPSAFVSNLFTGLCLAPALILFILWGKLGVNISNFPLSLSAIFFHVGLGSIFVLFGVFWLKLDMFVSLRYLLGLGVVTFLAGNKLLSQVAQKHKSMR